MNGEAKPPQLCDKIFWKWAVDFNHVSTDRVSTGQKVAMQQEALSRHYGSAIIPAVTDNRPAGLGQLLADLVSPTGDQVKLKECRPTVVVDWPESGQCGFHAALCEDRGGQLACLDDNTLYQCQVSFAHSSSHQFLAQLAGGLFPFAKQDGSGCARIKPVDRCDLEHLSAQMQQTL